jgi:pyruvate kinase
VSTIGPSSRDPATIGRMVDAGVDVFRINFSFGDRKSHGQGVRRIRAQTRARRRIVGILQDLPGPKIRIGKIRNGAVSLTKGRDFVLTTSSLIGDSTRATVNHPDMPSLLHEGDSLYLADGAIELKVIRVEDGRQIRCKVVNGGLLSSGKGLNAPGIDLAFKVPTDVDVSHLTYGLKLGVDFFALSFVRDASEITSARKIASQEKGGEKAFLIAKIEKREAVENFDSIVQEADGIMVARGDLGIEMPLEQVPIVQKKIIRRCNELGKPVMVATQILESMVDSLIPTRAEVSDISNAILDGADSLMLSDETAAGKYPVEAVSMLDRVARATDSILDGHLKDPPPGAEVGVQEAVGHAACSLAGYIGASAIVAPTQTGATVKRITKYRPNIPVIAMCIDERVARKLTLLRGVTPIMTRRRERVDDLFADAQKAIASLDLTKKGDRIVFASGKPGVEGSTDLVKVHTIA